MADDFKTFDKAPIVGVVNISRWSFGLREIILAAIAIFLFVLCLIFAGLFGRAEGELSDGSPSAAAVVGRSYCVDHMCLQTAARVVRLMNDSVDPCDDFFKYACGNYANVRTATYNKASRSVLEDIDTENQNRLLAVIEKPIDRMSDWASERKLKGFFQACNDMYNRERQKGTPFLDKVVTPLGGWDLLGTWDEASWDLNTVVKKVQADFWVDALFSPNVEVDWYNWKRYALELSPSGTGKWMMWEWYFNPNTQKYRDDYQTFIRRVGQLLMRDAKVTMDADTQAAKLDQFVNDTFTMETKLARLASNARYRNDPYLEVNKVTLNELTRETNNVLNWVEIFSYMFREATITGSTKVVLMRREFFQNMTTMISSLPDADRKRMLHHYLIWRVAEVYVQDLSWDYIHANRENYVDMFGTPRFKGLYRYCFTQTESYMRDALGALFISDHFGDENRQHVHEITDNIKSVLQDQLDKTPWMDDRTKAYAKDKLDKVTFKLGYPEWMANRDAVDSLYVGFDVNATDLFQNILNGNKYVRSIYARQLMRGEDRHEWIFQVYATNLAVYWYWNEVIAPAGILQNPIYDYRQPHFSTFGSLGSLLGRYLHHIVDDWGKHYDKQGNFMESDTWWTNQSLTRYKPVHDCVVSAYTNASQKVIFPDGEKVPINLNAQQYAPRAIATINGVRLALKGYRKWVKERGMSEKMLPGLGMTADQMILLSFAQKSCFDRNKYMSLINAYRGNLEEDLQVNIALSQLKEFSDAFKCKADSKMNAPDKCDYY